MENRNWDENDEIKRFQEYLRIPTVQPNVNYVPCVEFLQNQAKSLELSVKVFYPALPTKPVVLMTWIGTHPSEPSIILNSHMDVVPVFEEYWTHPPFAAEIDKEGRIYARGSQDMKCVGMQYLAAIRVLKRDNVRLMRTIHVLFMPDEELGGFLGMGKFVESEDFRILNAGFALDEGIAGPDDVFPIFYGERSVWQMQFKCSGTSGHGSLMLENTAAEKLQYLLNKFLDFRTAEKRKLEKNSELTLGDVTTVNLTILEGGVQYNLVPPTFTLTFDIRISIDLKHSVFEEMINGWCEEAGGDIQIIYVSKQPYVVPTKIDDSNPFWMAFKSVMNDDLKLILKPQIFPAGTDSRFLRAHGIPVIGFSPMNNTPVLLHQHNEFLNVVTYLRGIEIYKKLIQKIANV